MNITCIEDIKKLILSKVDLEEISRAIMQTKDPDLNYYAALNLGINKINHLLIVVESKNPTFNFKGLKHCIKTTSLTIEEKKRLIALHSQVILNSKNQKLIEELNRFLKYNSIYNYSKVSSNKRKK